MTGWRFLYTGPGGGAYNMAVDEALMLLLGQGQAPPTLRLYRWRRPCLSVGYFQSAARDIDLGRCRGKGVPVVRRPTGGRAILHQGELTYSLVALQDDPAVSGGVTESYAKVSQGLLAGLQALGVAAQAQTPGPARGGGGSPACFDAASGYEVTVAGKKLVGSAQVRRGGALLQHGSLLLYLDAEALFRLLRFPSEAARRQALHGFRSRVTSLAQVLGRPVAARPVIAALRRGFSQALNLELGPGPLSPQERALARRLARDKYSRPQWNLRR